MRAPVWTAVGAASGLLNVNFLLDLTSSQPAPLGSSVVSDLAAPGQPLSGAFRLADAMSALLLIALAVRLGRGHAGGRRRGRLAAASALTLFAASTLTAALVPITCPRSLSSSCPPESGQDVLHDAVSILGTTACLVAILLLARSTALGPRAARWHAVALGVSLTLGAALVLGQLTGSTGWFGWAQRAQIVVLSAWFVLAGREADAVHPREGDERNRPSSASMAS